MTNNEFIICSTCGECINLRIQMGNYSTPFGLKCPKCETEIKGEVNFEPFELTLQNAKRLTGNEKNFDELTAFPIWCLEVSSEFPTQKLHKRENYFDGPTPFLAQMGRLDRSEGAVDVSSFQDAITFAEFISEGKLENFQRLYSLYWNKKYKYLFPELNELLNEYKGLTPITVVRNVTDATMVLHQLLLTISGISSVLDKETLTEYTKLGKDIYSSKSHRYELLRFITHVENNFDKIEKSAFEKIETFSDVYSILIPVVTLLNTGKYDSLDQEKNGISAVSYRKLNEFYASSYEWILDNLNLIIALNNIFERNSYNDCYNNKDFTNDLEKIKNKFHKINLDNPQQAYLNPSELFSKPMDSLNNKIRNAIQHFNSYVDYDKQEIIFEDKYGDRTRIEQCSIIDFARLCLDNFSLMFYILEIVYTLRKLKLVTDVASPSIFHVQNEDICRVMSSNEMKSNQDKKLKNKIMKRRKSKRRR